MCKIISSKPKVIELDDGKEIFGEVKEITSAELGAKQANLAEVTLWGPDIIHFHLNAEETYVCLDGNGEIFIDGKVSDFFPGTKIIIPPYTLHAAKPKEPCLKLTFLCVSSPPFNPVDVHEDTRGRNW